jgi:hypothetical protein
MLMVLAVVRCGILTLVMAALFSFLLRLGGATEEPGRDSTWTAIVVWSCAFIVALLDAAMFLKRQRKGE